jgi:hypothetical protein
MRGKKNKRNTLSEFIVSSRRMPDTCVSALPYIEVTACMRLCEDLCQQYEWLSRLFAR